MRAIRRFCDYVTRFDWLILALILPIILFIRPALTPVLLILPLLLLLRRIATGHWITRTPLDGALLLMLLMVTVSLYATFDMAFSLGKVAGLTYGIMLYYAVAAFAQRRTANLWWTTATIATVGMALTAVGVLGSSGRVTSKLPFMQPLVSRVPSQFINFSSGSVNPNQTSGVITWVAPLLLAFAVMLVVNWRQWRLPLWQRIGLWTLVAGSTALLSGTLLITQSRSAIIGYMAAVLLLVAVALRKQRWLWLGGAVVVIVGVVVLLSTGGTALFEQLLGGDVADLGGNAVNSLEGRVEIWSRALYGLQDFPFTGMGMNNFRRVVHILYPLFLIAPNVDIAHAHNQILQAGLDLGLPGMIAFIAVWLGAAAMLVQSFRQTQTVWLRVLAAGLGAALLANFVYGLTDAMTLGSKPGFLFWMLMGLVAGLHKLVTTRVPAQ